MPVRSGHFLLVLLLGVVWGGVGPLPAQEPPVANGPASESGPPLRRTAAVPAEAVPGAELRWRLVAVQQAWSAGLPSVAGPAAEQLLQQLPPGDPARPWLRRVLARSGLAAGHPERVENGLARQGPADPVDRLWLALAALLRQRPGEAAEWLDGTTAEDWPVEDQPWFQTALALLAEAQGRPVDAAQIYARATGSVADPTLVTVLDLLRRRQQLLAGQDNAGEVAELRQTVQTLQGQRAGFEAARLLAISLSQAGQREEALAVLEEQLRFIGMEEGVLRAEFLYLLGYLSGPDSGRGRLALRELLRRPAPADLQEAALALLARPVGGPEQAGELAAFLTELIDQPRPHPLLDRLLDLRGSLYRWRGEWDAAEADATRLGEEFPASPRRRDALWSLAYLAWRRDPPQYRTAADFLGQLLRETAPGPEQNLLAVLQADCSFLNGDYANAAEAYAQALRTPGESAVGPVAYQLVLAWIRAGRIEEARRVLDENPQRLGPDLRWQAEWNYVDALRRAGQDEACFTRLRELLARRGPGEPTPDLALRLRWLELNLSVELRRLAGAPERAAELLELVAAAPSDALPDGLGRELDSRVRLLWGEALLAGGRAEEALARFEDLRQRHPTAEATALSFLVEARYAADQNRLVDAQQRLIHLADRLPESRYAPQALWEAALLAQRRNLSSTDQEAITLLERLASDYPGHELVYLARLRQADLSRRLNDFGAALLLYEDLLARSPDHPERHRAELSRADCLLAEAGVNPARLNDAAAAYERLCDLPDVPSDLRLEAACKWGFALARLGATDAAVQAYWTFAAHLLEDSPEAAALSPQGRYWLGRAILEMGGILEETRRFEEARRVYTRLAARDLPGRRLAAARLNRLTQP